MKQLSFHNPFHHGFARVAVAIPPVSVADPATNALATLDLARQAEDRGSLVTVFPELGLTGYAIDDLLQQDSLLEGALAALETLRSQTADHRGLLVVGLPIRTEAKIFNCAAVLHQGRVLGVVPKTYLPNYREYYEKRHFTSGRTALTDTVLLRGPDGLEPVPFGTDLIVSATNLPNFRLHVELCEDLWTPVPPSTWGALSGATVLCNLSASNVTIDKATFRRQLCELQSARCVAGYLYAGAGNGESTTDLAWDGHGLIAEYGDVLAETQRFLSDPQLLVADLDLDRLVQERSRLSSFNDTVDHYRDRLAYCRQVEVELELPTLKQLKPHHDLKRAVDRFPYVPNSAEKLDERCNEAYNIQVHGLTTRLRATGIDKVVIGVSGGLDSTHALVVAINAMENLGLPRKNVLAYTMPGFATSDRTLKNAKALMKALGVTAEVIDIRPSCEQMLKDLDHPYAAGQPVHDVTFENVQAGERTSHLFRLANHHRGLVVGTGDLSELALGWATYGVGDHMSHYNVNASVPKTLIQHLLRWLIKTDAFGHPASKTLQSIVETEISPELVPPPKRSGADHPGASDLQPAQSTQDIIGPYELQDFHLFYLTRYGYRPSKVAFLALQAWQDAGKGEWPATHPDDDHNTYDLKTIKKWLGVFLHRFFEFSQFKRSAVPNGPKVGSGGSLSPRGDWRAPSDAKADVWLQELKDGVPDQ